MANCAQRSTSEYAQRSTSEFAQRSNFRPVMVTLVITVVEKRTKSHHYENYVKDIKHDIIRNTCQSGTSCA